MYTTSEKKKPEHSKLELCRTGNKHMGPKEEEKESSNRSRISAATKFFLMLISNKTTTSSSSTTYKNSSPPSHSGPHNYRAERTSAHMLLLKKMIDNLTKPRTCH